jgi:hypothetical protein
MATTQKPIVDEPAVDEPTVDEPVVDEPEEQAAPDEPTLFGVGPVKGPGPKGQHQHTAALQASMGGYGRGTTVQQDGVIWISQRDNNMHPPGDRGWTLWG